MAKAKTKRVSINALEKITDEYVNEEVLEWNGLEITIKRTLSFSDMMKFVDSVAKSCFVQGSGDYAPEIFDFALRSNVLDTYANFTMPRDLEKQYAMVYCSGAYEFVLEHINQEQFRIILHAASDKVEKQVQANIEALNRRLEEALSAFEDMQKSIAEIFSGVQPDDLNKFVAAVNQNGGIDEEKILEAVINKDKKEE